MFLFFIKDFLGDLIAAGLVDDSIEDCDDDRCLADDSTQGRGGFKGQTLMSANRA